MITLFHFLRLAGHNLLRGGRRIIIALLCVTFGVMALVTMTMVAKPIERAILVEPAQLVGGDLSLGRAQEATIHPEHVAQLEALQQSGVLSRYTLIAYNSTSLVFHLPGAETMHFVGAGLGVEPGNYPLVGALSIGEPRATGLPTLLQAVGDVVITRDLALAYGLQPGDPIVLTDLRAGLPLAGTVRGIADDTPNHQGNKVYYTLETAETLIGGQPVVNTVIANTTQSRTAVETLGSSGWSVDWVAAQRGDRPGNAWVIGLRAAGILGLLVGGVSIAHTMQALLRRRQREIAVWKALGYHEGHLRLIFALEAGLLGLAGSLAGAGLGILLSSQALALLRRISTVLYQWSFSPTPPLMGILIGTATTVIFALWAILIAGRSRPMALLRHEPIPMQPLPGCQSAVLGLLLAAPVALLAGLVMESAVAGIGLVLSLVIGATVLGGFFAAALWVCTRLLPRRQLPLARLAARNLRRRSLSLVFAMIALFVGVIAMSLGVVVAQFGELRASGLGVAFDTQPYHLAVLATADQESAVRLAVQAQQPAGMSVGYHTALASVRVAGADAPINALDALLVGRADPVEYLITGATWGSRPDGVYVPAGANLAAGSQVDVTFPDGATRRFTVAGAYTINYQSLSLPPPSGLLVTADTFTQLAQPDAVTYFVQVAPNQVGRATADLRTALPQAAVVNLAAYADRFMHSYQRLFVIPLALAGLAWLAGCLLIANTVSLALLDRRYEIGILKTAGYARRQILAVFMVEYGLVGVVAAGVGVLALEGLLAVLALATDLPGSILLLSLPPFLMVAGGGVALSLLTVLGVAWRPTHLLPVALLNEWD